MARWDKISARGRVSDRRGMSGGVLAGGGITGILLIMGVTYLLGGNPLDVLTQVDPSQITQQQVNTAEFEGEDEYEVFASTVLGSNNAYWETAFARENETYVEPTLVLFRGRTQSSCGGAASVVGPHYCPVDNTIYLDETFFEQLQQRFGARGGDVAEAYVIAHEVGHHVQKLQGSLTGARRDNEASIALELQADCYAGLWAHSLRDDDVFEKNEILEAIDAAAAVGDDRIQQRTQGDVHPESWTHGSSEDRTTAFTTGYDSGDLGACLAYTS
ncbi:neutral zinc metallopeptidase [Candidatus Pacebacteria bacterium]|nr:neutral zinc metallopeptidase [Candidatus Paceibacterota bacterium]